MSYWSVLGNGNWRVENGEMTADQGADGSFLVSDLSFADFELQLEFWVDTDANSGVFIRCTDPESIDDTSCYEVNIFDTRPDQTYRTESIVNGRHSDPARRSSCVRIPIAAAGASRYRDHVPE